MSERKLKAREEIARDIGRFLAEWETSGVLYREAGRALLALVLKHDRCQQALVEFHNLKG